jgi:hypothetical protein
MYTSGPRYTTTVGKTYALGQYISFDNFKFMVKGVKTVDKYVIRYASYRDEWWLQTVRPGYTVVIVSVALSNLDVKGHYEPISNVRLLTSGGYEFRGTSPCLGVIPVYLSNTTTIVSRKPLIENYYVISFTEKCDWEEYWLKPESTIEYIYIFPMKADDKPLFLKFEVYGSEVMVRL